MAIMTIVAAGTAVFAIHGQHDLPSSIDARCVRAANSALGSPTSNA